MQAQRQRSPAPPPLVLDGIYPLTPEQIAAYRRSGHVYLPGVLSPSEAAAWRPQVRQEVAGQQQKLSAAERALGGSSSHLAFPLNDASPSMQALLTSPRLARIAIDLLGTSAVRILHYYGFFKEPGGPGTPWHQDSLFLPLDRDVVTIWLPLVPIPAPLAMIFARGSHRLGFVDLSSGSEDEDPARPALETLGFPMDEQQPMEAGDADFHSGMVVHCAPANTAAYVREVLAICYYPADARLVPNEEVLMYPGGEAGYCFRQELRRHYFPGVGDGEVAVGQANPIITVAPAGMESASQLAKPFSSRYHVTPDQVQRFQQQGHIPLRSAATPEEVATYAPAIAAAVERLNLERHAMEQAVDGSSQGWKFVNNLWRLDSAVRDLVLAERFGRIAADLMGVDCVRLFRDQSYFKAPGGGNTAWHQDAYFMPLDTDRVVTMWIALAPVTPDMAPMCYADGSHRFGYMGTSLPDDDAMDTFELDLLRHGFPVTTYGELQPGDASFHSGWTLHSTRTNRSDRQREAMVVVFFADGARIILPDLPPDASPQEQFALTIRLQNLRESLPDLAPGDLAVSDMTPIVYQR